MQTNLRPLTLGEILDRTAQLYRGNFVLFAGIFSIYSAVTLMAGLAQVGLTEWIKNAGYAGTQRPWVIWAIFGIGGVKLLAMFLLLGAAIAAISRTVASVHLGEAVTIRGAYASTLPRLGRYLWLMTVTGVLAWLPVIVLYAGFVGAAIHYGIGKSHAAGAAAATAQQQQAGVFLAIGAVFVVLAIPALLYTVWMSIRYSLAVPACVVENLKARQAIRRSIELSKGARWRILALGVLVVVIKLGVVALTQSFLFVAAFKHPGQISAGMNALSEVIQFFTNTLLGPIGATGLTLFYFDQRVRNEGYDIEWMMQAAGMATGTPEGAAPAEAAPGKSEPGIPGPAVAPTAVVTEDTAGSVHE